MTHEAQLQMTRIRSCPSLTRSSRAGCYREEARVSNDSHPCVLTGSADLSCLKVVRWGAAKIGKNIDLWRTMRYSGGVLTANGEFGIAVSLARTIPSGFNVQS
jgi:hypothetical protein